ncbi:MAG: hypothetical protein ACRC7O_07015, partial [Fimbriiglobus sp.]
MSAVLPRPPRGPAVPTPLRYTVAEFLDAAERGAFGDRKVMLIRGEVVEMAAMKEPHVCGVILTTDALRAAFGAGFTVRYQMPLDLRDSDPEPDVMVVPVSPRDYRVAPTVAQ